MPSVDDVVALLRKLVLAFHDVVKLAKHAMAMQEYWIMAAERVLRRAAHYTSPLQIFLAKVVAHAVLKPTICEPTPMCCAPAFLSDKYPFSFFA